MEFRHLLALRYRRSLLRVPGHCDGCGGAFNVDHAMNCKRGGLIVQRHNVGGDLATLVWPQVHRKPIIPEADVIRNILTLVADLGVRNLKHCLCLKKFYSWIYVGATTPFPTLLFNRTLYVFPVICLCVNICALLRLNPLRHTF